MPYEPELDVCLFSKFWEGDSKRLTVSIYSYNNGEKKLQIARENKNKDGELKFAKLGRMTKEEITAILPFIEEAMAQMS